MFLNIDTSLIITQKAKVREFENKTKKENRSVGCGQTLDPHSCGGTGSPKQKI